MAILLNGQIVQEDYCSHIYVTATAPTTLVNADTFYKLLGTTSVYKLVGEFINSDNRITYIGSRTRLFNCIVPFTISSNVKDIDVTFEIYKNGNGIGIVASRIKRTLRVANDIYLMSLASIIELAHNDYIELWASASVNNVIVTLQTMSFLVCG